jgi:hypothetical protein
LTGRRSASEDLHGHADDGGEPYERAADGAPELARCWFFVMPPEHGATVDPEAASAAKLSP